MCTDGVGGAEVRRGKQAADDDAAAVAHVLATTRETVSGKDAELDSLRRQLRSMEEATRARDEKLLTAEQTIADLTTDLDNMTREAHAVHADLAAAADTRAQVLAGVLC